MAKKKSSFWKDPEPEVEPKSDVAEFIRDIEMQVDWVQDLVPQVQEQHKKFHKFKTVGEKKI